MVAQWAKQMLTEYRLDDLIEEAEDLSVVRRKLAALVPLEQQLAWSASVIWSHQGSYVEGELIGKRYGIPEVYGWRPIEGPVREAFMDTIDRVLDEAFKQFSPALVESIQRVGGRAIAKAIEHRLDDFGIDASFSLAFPKATAWLDAHAADAVAGIDETTRAAVRRIVRDGADRGDSYSRIARAIVDKFKAFGEGTPQRHLHSRAQLVAVTETALAYETGNRTIIDELSEVGVAMEHKWLSVGDDRVSPGCRDNEAQGWIPANQLHATGHPYPPRFPGCRCCETYRRTDGAASPVSQNSPTGAFEQRIRALPYERAAAFDANGAMAFEQGGDSCHVRFTPDQIAWMTANDGVVLTHNHPDAPMAVYGFSSADLALACRCDLAEIRAVHTDGTTFVARRPGAGWPASGEIRAAFEEHQEMIQPSWFAAIARGEATITDACRSIGHEIGTALAQQHGFGYERILP